MSAYGFRYGAAERGASADDMHAYYGPNAAAAVTASGIAARRTTTSSAPIVNNYYVQDERSIPIPPFVTPNISMEDLALSQTQRSQPQPPSSLTPRPRLKRERELTHHEHLVNGSTAQSSAGGNALAKSSSHLGDVVNPYDKCYQGPVNPITEGEERAFVNESMDYYRRMKLPRKESLVFAGDGEGCLHEGSTRILYELKKMQEQYDHLNRVIEETRMELQRSREESDRERENSSRSVTDLRVGVAQLTKHVELLEGRHSSLEQSVSSIKGMQSLVDSLRGDLASLRSEVGQKSTAIAVLEKSVEAIKSHSFAPSTAVVPPAAPSFSAPAASATTNSTAMGSRNPFSFGNNSASGSKTVETVVASTAPVGGASVPIPSIPTASAAVADERSNAVQGLSFTPSSVPPPLGAFPAEKSTNGSSAINPFSLSKPTTALGAPADATSTSVASPFGAAAAAAPEGSNPFSPSSFSGTTTTGFGTAPIGGIPAADSNVVSFAQPLESKPSFAPRATESNVLGTHTKKKTVQRY